MKPKLAQFYLDVDYGVIKLARIEEDKLTFNTYARTEKGWSEAADNLVIKPTSFAFKAHRKGIKEILPPE